MTIAQNTQDTPDAPQGFIALEWHIVDVQTLRPELTEAQCHAVLQRVEHDHDATIGVNWSVLAYAAELLYGPPPEDDSQED